MRAGGDDLDPVVVEQVVERLVLARLDSERIEKRRRLPGRAVEHADQLGLGVVGEDLHVLTCNPACSDDPYAVCHEPSSFR